MVDLYFFMSCELVAVEEFQAHGVVVIDFKNCVLKMTV